GVAGRPPPVDTVIVYGIVQHPALDGEPRVLTIAQKGHLREHLKESSTDAVASTVADWIVQPWVDRINLIGRALDDPLHTAAAAGAVDGFQVTEHRYLLKVPAERLWDAATGKPALGNLPAEIASNFALPGDKIIPGIKTFLEVAGAAVALATGHFVSAPFI